MADPVGPIPPQDRTLLLVHEAAMTACDHGVTFDEVACEAMVKANKDQVDAVEVRRRWPRLDGACSKGCGFTGIAYASFAHMCWADW